MEKRLFTQQELADCNGKNGAPAYIAYRGIVYDVTGSFLWQQGAHQALHQAGMNLTGSLADAPHGDEFLEKFPTVGRYDSPL